MPAQIPSMACLRRTKSKALASLRNHKDPIIALRIIKHSGKYDNAIRHIGLDKLFVHFWTDLQLKIYREQFSNNPVTTISFDNSFGNRRCV